MSFSIKQSFANCFSCPLLDCDSCILETNCEDDLSKVDVVFVAENPGKDEVYKGFPLVGKTGQEFRKYFRVLGYSVPQRTARSDVLFYARENSIEAPAGNLLAGYF